MPGLVREQTRSADKVPVISLRTGIHTDEDKVGAKKEICHLINYITLEHAKFHI